VLKVGLKMTKRKKKPSLQLPHVLVEAIKDHRAVIVFGAGASKECINSAGSKPNWMHA
jgi:hypothetical protein